MLSMLFFMPAYATAQSEESVVFPISLGLLLAPALGILAVRWHPVWWARLLTAMVLLGSNVALWSPDFAETIGRFAGDDPRKTVGLLLIAPVAAAFAAGFLLKRVVTGRVA